MNFKSNNTSILPNPVRKCLSKNLYSQSMLCIANAPVKKIEEESPRFLLSVFTSICTATYLMHIYILAITKTHRHSFLDVLLYLDFRYQQPTMGVVFNLLTLSKVYKNQRNDPNLMKLMKIKNFSNLITPLTSLTKDRVCAYTQLVQNLMVQRLY